MFVMYQYVNMLCLFCELTTFIKIVKQFLKRFCIENSYLSSQLKYSFLTTMYQFLILNSIAYFVLQS